MNKEEVRKHLQGVLAQILAAFDNEKTDQIFLEITVHNNQECDGDGSMGLSSSNKMKYSVRPNNISYTGTSGVGGTLTITTPDDDNDEVKFVIYNENEDSSGPRLHKGVEFLPAKNVKRGEVIMVYERKVQRTKL